MSIRVEIEKVKGGYILSREECENNRELISTTEQLFENLLAIFEGRASCFHGDIYGKVMINREEPKREGKDVFG